MTTTRESSAPRPFDAVLCDLDNVIRFYDTSGLAELERAAALPVGTTAEVAFRPELDGPLLLGRTTVAQWVDSIALALTDGSGISAVSARELATAFADAPFAADEAVVSVLRTARTAGQVLVLVTNATHRLDDDLASMGLSDLADHVVSSARVGVAKPDRGIYEIAVERAGAAPERCLFVDDRLENVRAAVALGMTGVHYREPADLRDALGFPI
ncbi:HAD-IA family hydrolase [Streptomyces sp. NPDC096339]|uniref:HAD-IA family hydrolase n=1 Tax=Streptomyces sp. NPDC096339 TaxID=3366086 RepID=UPI0038042DC2